MGKVIDMRPYHEAREKKKVETWRRERQAQLGNTVITRGPKSEADKQLVIPRQKFDAQFFAKFLAVTDAEHVLPTPDHFGPIDPISDSVLPVIRPNYSGDPDADPKG